MSYATHATVLVIHAVVNNIRRELRARSKNLEGDDRARYRKLVNDLVLAAADLPVAVSADQLLLRLADRLLTYSEEYSRAEQISAVRLMLRVQSFVPEEMWMLLHLTSEKAAGQAFLNYLIASKSCHWTMAEADTKQRSGGESFVDAIISTDQLGIDFFTKQCANNIAGIGRWIAAGCNGDEAATVAPLANHTMKDIVSIAAHSVHLKWAAQERSRKNEPYVEIREPPEGLYAAAERNGWVMVAQWFIELLPKPPKRSSRQ